MSNIDTEVFFEYIILRNDTETNYHTYSKIVYDYQNRKYGLLFFSLLGILPSLGRLVMVVGQTPGYKIINHTYSRIVKHGHTKDHKSPY